MSVALSAVPALSSLPNAPVTIYLDFNGQPAQSWGTFNVTATPAYTIDSDVTNFSDQEVAAINEIWARVAEKYSPFNINVTTVDPGSFAAKKAMKVVIGGSGAWTGATMGGYSYIGTFATGYGGNISWVFSANLGNTPSMVAEAAAHESGHQFGLNHQSSYNGATKITDYNKGDSLRAPIMGNSYYAQRGLWWKGTSSSSTTIQDDLAILVTAANNVTYRADDHSNSLTAGDAFSISGVNVSAKGIITTTADVDSFTFTTAAGLVSFTGNVNNLAAMLDLKLSLYNSAGALLQTVDTASLGETLSANLAAGTYTLVVGSHGGYGDIGQFTVTGTLAAATPAPAKPAGLAVTATSSSSISLAWSDNTNETGYSIQRSTDNVNFSTIATTGANATSYMSTGLSAATKYYFRIAAANGSGSSDWTASVNGTTKAAADVTPPTVTAKTPAPGATITTATTNIDVTFSENVIGVDANDLILTGTGATSAIKGTPTLVSGTTWRFPVSGLKSGAVNVSIAPAAGNINDTSNNSLANVAWSFNVSIPPAALLSAKINFQDSKSAGYTGYFADTGAVYASRGNGYTYGWSIDISAQSRNRNNAASPDERYDTLMQMQRPGNVATWEIAVPNGNYSVRIVAGDASYTDSVYKINVENTLAISGTPNATTKFFDNTVQVAVTDGKLTVSNATGSSNNKICFIEITQLS